jgi:hypothetical protein
MLYTREESLLLPGINPTYHVHTKSKDTATITISHLVLRGDVSADVHPKFFLGVGGLTLRLYLIYV